LETNIRPTAGRVLVQVDVPDSVAGGIILVSAEKDNYAHVVAVGPGVTRANGRVVAPVVSVGDKILMSSYGGTEVKQDGVTYELLYEADILAVIT